MYENLKNVVELVPHVTHPLKQLQLAFTHAFL